MQEFMESTAGAVTTAFVGVLLFFTVVGALNRGKRMAVKVLTFSSIMIAVAVILSVVAIFKLPYGGSVTLFSMLCVILIGYRYGAAAGFSAAMAYGLLQFALGPYFYHPVQFLLDYILGFGALGASGLFRSKAMRGMKLKLGKYSTISLAFLLAICVPMLLRLMFSTISGVVFFWEYAPVGKSPLMYSLEYNASYIVPEMIITLILVSIPQFKIVTDIMER